MKAIIIADNDLVIENVKTVLKSYGYDTIIYRWLLKALDNLEEISPHLIVVSSADYPRHWKTLAQFASSGISGFFPQVVLYTDGTFNDEENEKAKTLGVRGCFSSVTADGLDELRKILETKDDIFSGNPVANIEDEYKGPTVEAVVAKNTTQEEDFDIPTVDGIFENNGKTVDEIDVAPVEKIFGSENQDEIEEPQEFSEVDATKIEQKSESAFEEATFEDFSEEQPVSENNFEESSDEDLSEEQPLSESNFEESLDEDFSEEQPLSESNFEESLDETVSENSSSDLTTDEPAVDEAKDDYDDPFGPIDYDTVFDDDDFTDGHEYISCMFTNPKNRILVTGTVASLNGSTLEFLPDFGEFAEGISLGNEISECVMKRGTNVIDVSAQVTDKTADGFTFYIKEK